MRSCKAMRQDAWALMTKSPWGWRVFGASVLLSVAVSAAVLALGLCYEACDVPTWEKFQESALDAKRSGLTMAVPSMAEAWRMTFGTGFLVLARCLFCAIAAFGTAAVLVKALANEEDGWLGAAFGGFTRPLQLLGLQVRAAVQVVLWTLLLILPGIVAAFRYVMVWFVKAENRDFSAAACLRESGRIMRGRKVDYFVFCLSYIGWYLLCLMPICVFIAAVATKSPVGAVLGLLVLSAWIPLICFVGVYLKCGVAIFYRDAKAEAGTQS